MMKPKKHTNSEVNDNTTVVSVGYAVSEVNNKTTRVTVEPAVREVDDDEDATAGTAVSENVCGADGSTGVAAFCISIFSPATSIL